MDPCAKAECKILLEEVNKKIKELDSSPSLFDSFVAGFKNCIVSIMRGIFE
jgi:hypothetical protein